MNAGDKPEREERALDALFVSTLRRVDRDEDTIDPDRLPQLTEEERVRMNALGSDFIKRLLAGERPLSPKGRRRERISKGGIPIHTLEDCASMPALRATNNGGMIAVQWKSHVPGSRSLLQSSPRKSARLYPATRPSDRYERGWPNRRLDSPSIASEGSPEIPIFS